LEDEELDEALDHVGSVEKGSGLKSEN
jgi:hypothetical protein